MHKIEAPGATQDNTFTEGDPSTGTPATEVSSAWLNAVQGELVKVIEAAGLTLQTADTETKDQLLAALAALAPAQNIAVFDATGVTEWTVPDVLKNGHRKAHVTVIPGGGGGSRGGAGAGGRSEGLVDLTGVSTVSITVGAGGIGTDDTTTGGAGGSSSFGTYISVPGGEGGQTGNNQRSGGSQGTGGDINVRGGDGSSANRGGLGGGVIGNGGTGFPETASGSGGPGRSYGDGGGGGIVTGTLGGDGHRGIVIVRW